MSVDLPAQGRELWRHVTASHRHHRDSDAQPEWHKLQAQSRQFQGARASVPVRPVCTARRSRRRPVPSSNQNWGSDDLSLLQQLKIVALLHQHQDTRFLGQYGLELELPNHLASCTNGDQLDNVHNPSLRLGTHITFRHPRRWHWMFTVTTLWHDSFRRRKPAFLPMVVKLVCVCYSFSVHLEPWCTRFHTWIDETYEKIIWIHGLYEFIYIFIYMDSCTYEIVVIINSYMKWSYEFIGYMNSRMKWSYEFMSTWIHVHELNCIDSEIIYEFKYMNSDIVCIVSIWNCWVVSIWCIVSIWYWCMNALYQFDTDLIVFRYYQMIVFRYYQIWIHESDFIHMNLWYEFIAKNAE